MRSDNRSPSAKRRAKATLNKPTAVAGLSLDGIKAEREKADARAADARLTHQLEQQLETAICDAWQKCNTRPPHGSPEAAAESLIALADAITPELFGGAGGVRPVRPRGTIRAALAVGPSLGATP